MKKKLVQKKKTVIHFSWMQSNNRSSKAFSTFFIITAWKPLKNNKTEKRTFLKVAGCWFLILGLESVLQFRISHIILGSAKQSQNDRPPSSVRIHKDSPWTVNAVWKVQAAVLTWQDTCFQFSFQFHMYDYLIQSLQVHALSVTQYKHPLGYSS